MGNSCHGCIKQQEEISEVRPLPTTRDLEKSELNDTMFLEKHLEANLFTKASELFERKLKRKALVVNARLDAMADQILEAPTAVITRP